MKKSETSSQSASGKKVVIVGGGASGMMAAITAARNGAKVVILEHKDRIGKKILSTGNGRCNFTEYVADTGMLPLYGFGISVESSFHSFLLWIPLHFFRSWGFTRKIETDICIPIPMRRVRFWMHSRLELESLKVEIQTETEVMGVYAPVKHGFTIRTSKGKVSADRVILSTGCKAAPKTGSDGSGYGLAKSLGHHLTPVVPALVQTEM